MRAATLARAGMANNESAPKDMAAATARDGALRVQTLCTLHQLNYEET
ncbi:hypothetical protein [Paraburkholderia sp. BL18I3N2]|nr:hypothetical protein [Paraburkholderia sp. BL18I3N2]